MITRELAVDNNLPHWHLLTKKERKENEANFTACHQRQFAERQVKRKAYRTGLTKVELADPELLRAAKHDQRPLYLELCRGPAYGPLSSRPIWVNNFLHFSSFYVKHHQDSGLNDRNDCRTHKWSSGYEKSFWKLGANSWNLDQLGALDDEGAFETLTKLLDQCHWTLGLVWRNCLHVCRASGHHKRGHKEKHNCFLKNIQAPTAVARFLPCRSLLGGCAFPKRRIAVNLSASRQLRKSSIYRTTKNGGSSRAALRAVRLGAERGVGMW